MILDLTGKPCSVEHEVFLMPDGQPHIQLVDSHFDGVYTDVRCSLTSMDDVGKLLVACDALIANGAQLRNLEIYYFLGARQDRRIKNEALTVKVIGDLIKYLLFHKVKVLHPHSDAVGNCFDSFEEIDHTVFVKKAIDDFKPDFLIIPDLGAAKNAAKYDKFDLPQIQCGKVRDTKTGKLSGFKVYDEVPEGRGLVLDDICDGGGTFMGLKSLFPDNNLGLYTTHGIYSKGFDSLNKVFEKTYCTNSYRVNGLINCNPEKNILFVL